MLKLFKNDVLFCDSSFKPWLTILACCFVAVLAWGIYQHEDLDLDDLEPDSWPIKNSFSFSRLREYFFTQDDYMEKLDQGIPGNAIVLATFTSGGQAAGAPGQRQEPIQYPPDFSKTPAAADNGVIGNANALHSLENAFNQAIESVRPAVVQIKSTKLNGNTANQNSTLESVGSGLIVSPQGYILTNYHVIANAYNIYVSVYGTVQKTYSAWVLDHHNDTDLTLLKLDTEDIFVTAKLGNSDLLQVGDMVLAIGSPFGMEQTVTSGIVSSIGKTLVIDGVRYENMIQTDASINRGSSGGPLVNINGEVIGINTAIYSPTGVFSGTAFAMPVNRIRRFLAAHNILLDGGPDGAVAGGFQQAGPANTSSGTKGWLGVEIQSVDQTTALHLGLPYTGGVLVNGVRGNSPAFGKGVKRGDVILEVNEDEVMDLDHFEILMANHQADELLRLLVFSKKQLKELSVTLSQFPG